MNTETANRLRLEYGKLIEGEDRWPISEIGASLDNLRYVRVSLKLHLEDYLPEPEEAIAFKPPDGPALIVALAGDVLHTVRASGADENGYPIIDSRCTRLDPDHAAVSISTRAWTAYGETWREARWMFELNEQTTLRIVTEARLEQSKPTREEAFARTLAARLGWDVPPYTELTDKRAA